ncbi:uncharacterized protein LOC143461550 [Clavelina lepadiformis]|uniref:uncharacterized protein LOC143461550 n=1 Tax=Clavelina lepadiformis TaxID=159417 RepID=UPI00404337A2
MKLSTVNILRVCVFTLVIMFLVDAGIGGAEARRHGQNRRGEKRKSHKKNVKRQLTGKSKPSSKEEVEARYLSTYLEQHRRERAQENAQKSRRIRKPGSGHVDLWTEAKIDVSAKIDKSFAKVHEAVGKYGYHSRKNNVSGKLVHVRDPGRNTHLGCNYAIANTHHIPKNRSWIALIERGQCIFFHKLRLGELHNASAVIVYNNRHEEAEVMNTIGINTTSLMINKADGEKLASMVDSGKDVYLNISVSRTHKPCDPTAAEQVGATPPTSAARKGPGNGNGSARTRGSYQQILLFSLLNFFIITLFNGR